MAKQPGTHRGEVSGQGEVATIAGRILHAWNDGQGISLQRELGRAEGLNPKADSLTSLEMERMEVLESAIETLRRHQVPSRSAVEASGDQVRAAVRLLEHLANAQSGLRPSH